MGARIVRDLSEIDRGAPVEDVAELLRELRTLARIGLAAQIQAMGRGGEVPVAGGVEEALERAPRSASVDRRVGLKARRGPGSGVAGRVGSERGRSSQKEQDDRGQQGQPRVAGRVAVRFHGDEGGYSESRRSGGH